METRKKYLDTKEYTIKIIQKNFADCCKILFGAKIINKNKGLTID